MPHDLFDAVTVRPRSGRSGRSPLVLVSIVTHGALLGAAVCLSILAPDSLPFPQRAIAFFEAVPVRLVDIDLPARAKKVDTATAKGPLGPPVPDPKIPDQPTPLTPTVAPDGIAEETGAKGTAPSASHGPGDGIGSPSDGPVTAEPVRSAKPVDVPPVRLHSGITAPRKIVDVAPIFPLLARETRVDGIVILEATIDAQGDVRNVQVLRSVTFLDQAAIDAVRQWRFEPARLNGAPIPVIMTITVRFALTR